jgi:hypothetical protein
MLHLEEGETVLMEIRKHWFVFFAEGFFLSIAAIMPPIIYSVVAAVLPIDIDVAGNSRAFLSFIYSLWLLLLWIAFFVQWTNYYLDVWYVTQKRIIDVEQKRLFHREVSSIRFDKVQDITVDVKGILATFLNIGDIKVQTAGETSQHFVMKYAANPDRVRKIVFSRHNQEAERARPVQVIHPDGDGN